MKTLLILRHAKSSWAGSNPDHQRPLNSRGRRDAPRIGRLLREEDLVPDLILTSTAARALETAELVADASGFGGPLEKLRAFYHAPAEIFLETLRSLSGDFERVMIVAHNPGLEELLAELTGEDELLPTAALAHVALPISSWRHLRAGETAELVNLWRPRELQP
jgi:phosphohistidine phosphatase